MGTVDIKKIEEDIHNVALTRRIRPSQFFVDYDRLRSGAVTGMSNVEQVFMMICCL
jgi:hypothetical protein